MTFLPIVDRELRVTARRRFTYWSRFAAGLIGLALAALVLINSSSEPPAQIGLDLFQTLACLLFLLTPVAGLQATADCLSEEKREGTLGLLFLTDLKGYDVVIGKIAAASLQTIYGMMAVVPALAIPILLGGVRYPEIGRVVLVVFNLLFFFLSVGIFASSVCRQDHAALALAILLSLVVLLAGPMFFAFYLEPHHVLNAEWILVATPATGCFTFPESAYATRPPVFWINASLTFIYSAILLRFSCFIVPRSWHDTSVPAPGSRRRSWRAWLGGGPVRRSLLLAINPYLWRASRSRFLSMSVWIALFLGIIGWACLGKLFDVDLFNTAKDITTVLFAHALLKCWVALQAARNFSEDRRAGGMELLLSTPLSTDQIIRGQRRALWNQFAAPVIALLLAEILFLYKALGEESGDDRIQVLAIFLIFGSFLVLDLSAIAWISMWQAIVGRRPNRAAILSVGWVVALPVVAFWVAGTPLAFIAMKFNLTFVQNHSGSCVAAFWILLGLSANAFFAGRAKRSLFNRLRSIVTEKIGRSSPG